MPLRRQLGASNPTWITARRQTVIRAISSSDVISCHSLDRFNPRDVLAHLILARLQGCSSAHLKSYSPFLYAHL